MNKPSVLFISNSQGTAAGLGDTGTRLNYPSLIADQLPELNCHYWLMSDNSVAMVDSLFSEMVVQCQPDIIVLQCGIIEAGLRILPKRWRNFFNAVPGGNGVTGIMQKNRSWWINSLHQRGWRFVEIGLKDWEQHLKNICQKCRQHDYKLLLVNIPLLSENCEATRLPGNNPLLNQYNKILKELAPNYSLSVVEPFAGNTDLSRNSLYIDDTVHFSAAGHQLISANLKPIIANLLAEHHK